jgi:sugar transferase (PEP-CTERM/EpsH1 system associated)
MRRQRKTICHVLHSLRVGGAEVLAARLARRLRDTYRFVFVCLDELGTLGQELRDEGVPVHLLGRRPGVDWRCSYRLAGILRREKVDLVHAHQYTPFFYTLTARLIHRPPAILFTEHGRHHPDYPRQRRILVNRLLLERRDRVVGVGQAVGQALINNEGIPPQRVTVIHNGIDVAKFAANGHDRRVTRHEMGVGKDDLVILQVARLDYLKDHGTAMRTLKRVVQHRNEARLVLVGDGPEKQSIEEMTRCHNLSSNVRLLGLRTDIPRLLAAADLFLLTSISEGIPLTIIEAMAAGLPVVSTQVGGVAEVVTDGSTAELAPSGDDAKLAEKILRVAEDPRLAQAMGRRGRERAHALFSEGRMHDRYLQLFKEMLHD